jgi:hypothetical protein
MYLYIFMEHIVCVYEHVHMCNAKILFHF